MGSQRAHIVLPDELIEEIGHGGMGVIFKARQRSLDRIVAVKLIRAGSLARAAWPSSSHSVRETPRYCSNWARNLLVIAAGSTPAAAGCAKPAAGAPVVARDQAEAMADHCRISSSCVFCIAAAQSAVPGVSCALIGRFLKMYLRLRSGLILPGIGPGRAANRWGARR